MNSKVRFVFALLATAILSLAVGYTLNEVVALANGETQALSTPRAEVEFPVDTRPIDRSSTQPAASYSPIINQASPSVVSVYTARVVKVVSNRSYNPQEELLRRFFGLPGPQQNIDEGDVEEKRMPTGVGSGVIISEDGYILTNHHVVSDSRGEEVDEVLVRLSDGRELSAEIVGRDQKTDVAVLKVDAVGLPALPMADSDNLVVGDVVFAIGNPMGIGQTVTMGIVSATRRSGLRILGDEGYESFIQTDASINPGNSGGALIDAEGRLVGVNSAILSQTGGNIGIGFAIPINLARNIMTSLITKGKVERGFLGVNISDLDADMADAFGLPDTKGALIQQVQEDLPADQAGLKRGDVVTAVGGKPVSNSADLRLAISQTPPGTTVKLDIIRDGKPKTLEVELGNLDDPYGTGISISSTLLEGVSVEPVNDDLREKYQIDERIDGLAITGIEPRSAYSRGLREGMVIVEINDRKADNIETARKLLRRGVNKFWIYQNGSFGYLAVRIP